MPSATRGDERGIRGIGATLVATLLLIAPVSASEERASQAPEQSLADLPTLDPSYQMTTHKVVLITATALNPATVHLDPGQLIAWISYSPSQSTVVFERSVAKSMICHSRVNFSFEEGELRSTPIDAGEFASFCQLKPGRYRYKVVRSGASEGSGATLEGEIVVGEE